MRILVAWDVPEQADLISLYLGVEQNEVAVATEAEEILAEAGRRPWDVVLLSTTLPDGDGAFRVFEELRRRHSDVPVVGACHTTDVFRIAKFVTHGMRSYVLRDADGDFVFLLETNLEGVVHAVRAEREQAVAAKLREEIDSVRRLQETIIPRSLECPPGYRVAARYETSQLRVMGGRPVSMAGGDYYDVFRTDEDHNVLLVGDASGHGMKACMSILTMHTLVRMIRNNRYDRTADFVAEVNDHLCEQSVVSQEGGFITLLYGILHAGRGEFQWSSAGHPPPLLHDLDAGTVEPIGSEDAGGLPLGIAGGAEYDTYAVSLPRRSRLLLYTDGLAEAFPGDVESHAEFGTAGIVRTLKQSSGLPPEGAMQALFDASNAFTRGSGRHDDTSVVLLERYEAS